MIYIVNGLRGLDAFTVISGILGDNFHGRKYFSHSVFYHHTMPFGSTNSFDSDVPNEDFLEYLKTFKIILRDPDTKIKFLNGKDHVWKSNKIIDEHVQYIMPKDNYIILSYISEEEIRTLQSIAGIYNVKVFNIVENPLVSFRKFIRDGYLCDMSNAYKIETGRYDGNNDLRFEMTAFILSLVNAVKLKKKYPIIKLEDIKKSGISYGGKTIKIYPDWYDESAEDLLSIDVDDFECIINNLGFDLMKELGY